MSARAHLRLIVSEPPAPAPDERLPERVSLIQPLSLARRGSLWLRRYRGAAALGATSAGLLTFAALRALGWW